jgi:hypothetical protein
MSDRQTYCTIAEAIVENVLFFLSSPKSAVSPRMDKNDIPITRSKNTVFSCDILILPMGIYPDAIRFSHNYRQNARSSFLVIIEMAYYLNQRNIKNDLSVIK